MLCAINAYLSGRYVPSAAANFDFVGGAENTPALCLDKKRENAYNDTIYTENTENLCEYLYDSHPSPVIDARYNLPPKGTLRIL